jgi:hypothetical protein
MVRAILDGRKTQTRRIVKPPPANNSTKNTQIDYDADGDCIWWRMPGPMVAAGAKNPYGVAGDRLWVREMSLPKASGTIYRADYDSKEAASVGAFYGGWKPSIFMPRAASRITLEITAVRVERLQDISEADAKAEGIILAGSRFDTPHIHNEEEYQRALQFGAIEIYKSLWESINSPGSWAKNPWVWVVEFKKI